MCESDRSLDQVVLPTVVGVSCARVCVCVCVCVCHCKASTMRRPWPTRGCRAVTKENNLNKILESYREEPQYFSWCGDRLWAD